MKENADVVTWTDTTGFILGRFPIVSSSSPRADQWPSSPQVACLALISTNVMISPLGLDTASSQQPLKKYAFQLCP